MSGLLVTAYNSSKNFFNKLYPRCTENPYHFEYPCLQLGKVHKCVMINPQRFILSISESELLGYTSVETCHGLDLLRA